ncbi:hypothetical protein ACFLVW_01795 [Chloroflexota bacterium]
MNEGIKFLVAFGIYTVFVIIPFMVYLNRGRKSGKVGPKLAATLLALIYVAVPLIGIGIDLFLRKILDSGYLQYCGLIILIFWFVWLAAYAGPFGIGWTGKWDDYVYPTRKKKELPLTEETGVSAMPGKLSQIIRTWRVWTAVVVLSEIVIFVGCGLLIHNNLLIVIGIIVAPIHLVFFLAIWHWRQRQLKQKGWRW